ncbi:MAG: tetratricopeptide repeat protein [Candidatus Helarchaeota archaeon]|nr:tetratricopeptide repeat protein [Candidatus Helarchaeota archaeon]
MNDNFLEHWNQAKRHEEDGHKFFQEAKFHEAAESHKKAASLFRKAIEFLDENDEKEREIRNKTLGNHYIELANYYHSLATDYFYNGDKQRALEKFRQAIQEQKSAIEEYEKLKKVKQFKQELTSLKIALHFLLAHENICLAQIAFLNEKYREASEYFKTAEIHSNLEYEFTSELGDLGRLKRAKGRSYYSKGQILRSKALEAMQEGNIKNAKENYLKASQIFEAAVKLNPKWKEYSDLAKKSKKMGLALKTR